MSTPVPEDATSTLSSVLGADALALGRAISQVMRESDDESSLRTALAAHLGGAHRIGITGPPGVGKSTLLGALGRLFVERGQRVGVVACDPVSPYSGGAFLGDRVRLAGFRLADDPLVFFRSLACRDAGGIAAEAARVADVLDAAGFPRIFLETLGVGQSELAVRDVVDTVVVVLTAELGDDMQLLKAGILEIADIIVLNRADRGGAEKFREILLQRYESSAMQKTDWTPRVILTEATGGRGVESLLEAIEAHGALPKKKSSNTEVSP